MNLQNLKELFIVNGCQKVYYKLLAPNDNSKNQVYLGGSFEVLNIFPISEIQAVEPGDWKRQRFKATINFSWISDDGNIYPAPHSQLILYPKYPEVRFSGFLNRCENAPSELMASRLEGRILFFSITAEKKILGYVASSDSTISKEITQIKMDDQTGVFNVIYLPIARNGKAELFNELLRIHNQGWINSKKLDVNGAPTACESSNCGGYTLEAELGIIPNGRAEPDYKGWEVKQYGVSNLAKPIGQSITLMTPEPTGGIYVDKGLIYFIQNYGYPDKMHREDRMNFGGIHKVGATQPSTGLRMELQGYDNATEKITNAGGVIALIDNKDNIAASWDFASMLKHWNKKHNQACYVPSLSDKEQGRKYKYGNIVILGEGTDFQLFLKQMYTGNIFYDPGIKLENISTKPKSKRRSQFRIKSQHLGNLYNKSEVVTISPSP